MSSKFRLKDIGSFAKELGLSILKGDFMRRIKVSNYFIHILYTFILFFFSIWLSLMMEKTFAKVERNREILKDMEIYHAQKTVEVASLNRMTKIQDLLREKGSQVTMPAKPAIKTGK